ncbi:hypothetical protein N7298_20325 [Aeromonas caviae]|uniref:hypothetical protein n=1 Tax=Aeromonas caviae TaxID=648 RepID=UPI002449D0EB|nr:hypothetical protein [Aeromonas caviae]MDH0361133.1 hypothetical protein [Aeromonas caviae]
MHNTLFRTALLAAALGSFSHTASAEGVMVHLFQWKFNDIANECETVLGPKGFGGVQITPPAEHKQGSQVWWTVYQPVSFKNFNSFGGSEAELRSMIARCNAAGVKVYADAVFNQLASGSGTATGGGSYNSGQFQYPQFGYNDFHHSGDITNYGYQDEDGRLPLALGYALTVYASQGTTIDGDVFVYWTSGMDKANSYVAGSRHKDNCHWFFNRQELDPEINSTETQDYITSISKIMSYDRRKYMAKEYIDGFKNKNNKTMSISELNFQAVLEH